MKWFKKRPPATTGKVIDMTKTFWGHNISVNNVSDKGEWGASIWVAHRPVVGDEIVWSHSAGVVRSIITDVRAAPSVWDMSFIEGTITHLNDEKVN